MAQILNFGVFIPDLNVSDSGVTLGYDFEFHINYRVYFTPMEVMLASYGLSFRESIELFEIDPEGSQTEPADENKVLRFRNTIASSDIVATLGATRPLTLDRTVTEEFIAQDLNVQITGENQDFIRAIITISPFPYNAEEIGGITALSRLATTNLIPYSPGG